MHPDVTGGHGHRQSVLAAWLAVLGLTLAGLHALAAVLPAPPADPTRLTRWLGDQPPEIVAFAAVRVAALLVGWYLVLATVSEVIARLRPRGAFAVVARRVTIPVVRRVVDGALGVTAVTALSLGPMLSLAAAAEHHGGEPTSSVPAVRAPKTRPNEPPPVLRAATPAPVAERPPTEETAPERTPGATSTSVDATPSRTASTSAPTTTTAAPTSAPTSAPTTTTTTSATAATGSTGAEPPGTTMRATAEAAPSTTVEERPPTTTSVPSPMASGTSQAKNAALEPATPPGPGAMTPPQATAERVSSDDGGTLWTIEPGDHLWSIAERTLERSWGTATSDREIATYWRTLIEHNRDALRDPSNPDLVFPGDTVALPPVPPRAT